MYPSSEPSAPDSIYRIGSPAVSAAPSGAIPPKSVVLDIANPSNSDARFKATVFKPSVPSANTVCPFFTSSFILRLSFAK